MKSMLLGIDPSFVTMGIALYDPATKALTLKTDEFLSGIDWINENCRLRDVIAVVENPALDSTTFDMWALMKDAIDKLAGRKLFKNGAALAAPGGGIEAARSQFAICMNYAQKVGENKAAAKMVITLLRKYGVPVIEIAPSKRDKAFTKKNGGPIVRRDVRFLKMPTKTTQGQFEEYTGFKGSSAEHARDAATLVFGRTMAWAFNTLEIDEARKIPPSFPKTENNNFFIVEQKKAE